jgi:hypothetical protein
VTADQLQRLARMLGNQSWCRYWLHYNWPETAPWEMALSCVEFEMRSNRRMSNPCPVPDLLPMGFRATVSDAGLIVYTIVRTNEDGTPFRPEKP